MYLQTVTTHCVPSVEQSTRTTICLAFPVQRNMAACMYHLIRRLSISICKRDAGRMWRHDSWLRQHIHVTVLSVQWLLAKAAAELAKAASVIRHTMLTKPRRYRQSILTGEPYKGSWPIRTLHLPLSVQLLADGYVKNKVMEFVGDGVDKSLCRFPYRY